MAGSISIVQATINICEKKKKKGYAVLWNQLHAVSFNSKGHEQAEEQLQKP